MQCRRESGIRKSLARPEIQRDLGSADGVSSAPSSAISFQAARRLARNRARCFRRNVSKSLEAGVAEQAIAAWRGQVGTSLSYLQPQGSQLGELSFIARPDLDKSIGDEEDRTR